MCVCVCVYVCIPIWIQRCPGGPLFPVGASNPFKSALLIPLSSHSGFMQAHTSMLTTVHAGCVFCLLHFLKYACLLACKDRVRLEDQYQFPLRASREFRNIKSINICREAVYTLDRSGQDHDFFIPENMWCGA